MTPVQTKWIWMCEFAMKICTTVIESLAECSYIYSNMCRLIGLLIVLFKCTNHMQFLLIDNMSLTCKKEKKTKKHSIFLILNYMKIIYYIQSSHSKIIRFYLSSNSLLLILVWPGDNWYCIRIKKKRKKRNEITASK